MGFNSGFKGLMYITLKSKKMRYRRNCIPKTGNYKGFYFLVPKHLTDLVRKDICRGPICHINSSFWNACAKVHTKYTATSKMAQLRMITVRSMSGSKPFLMHKPKQFIDCLIVHSTHYGLQIQ